MAITMAAAVCFAGCSAKDSPPAENSTSPKKAEAEPTDDGDKGDPTVAAALAKLSAQDRAAADKQRICPVSEEPLGSMGVPPKLTVNGREVFICCDSCADAVTDSPDEYLAKIPK
jgi:hypothetical protein